MNELLPADTFSLLVNLISIFGLIYVIQLHFLLKKLKKHETQEWKRLGSFTLIMNHSLRGFFLVLKWLLCKEYLRLDNREIFKDARLCRNLLIAAIVCLIALETLY